MQQPHDQLPNITIMVPLRPDTLPQIPCLSLVKRAAALAASAASVNGIAATRRGLHPAVLNQTSASASLSTLAAMSIARPDAAVVSGFGIRDEPMGF
jgi:hypothetical protein